jgi:hypothetical protein
MWECSRPIGACVASSSMRIGAAAAQRAYSASASARLKTMKTE